MTSDQASTRTGATGSSSRLKGRPADWWAERLTRSQRKGAGVRSGLSPSWVTWLHRPFPDANLLLLPGRQPALVDSGSSATPRRPPDWVRAHTGQLSLVVNTHWHSDHVGGNALLQATGAGIAAGMPDADAVARRDPGCCQAEYLDQPVAPTPSTNRSTTDSPAARRRRVAGRPHPRTHPGHLSLWQPDERLLAVGDALSDYDVGWVNLALDGPDAAATALASLHRLADLPRACCFPPTAPSPPTPAAALAAAADARNVWSTTRPGRSGTAPAGSSRSP